MKTEVKLKVQVVWRRVGTVTDQNKIWKESLRHDWSWQCVPMHVFKADSWPQPHRRNHLPFSRVATLHLASHVGTSGMETGDWMKRMIASCERTSGEVVDGREGEHQQNLMTPESWILWTIVILTTDHHHLNPTEINQRSVKLRPTMSMSNI